MSLYNSIFLDDERSDLPSTPSQARGDGREIKNMGKTHAEVICPHPSRGSGTSWLQPPCAGAAWKGAGSSLSCCRNKAVREPLGQPSASATGSCRLKLRQRRPFVLIYGQGDE